ncbi:MAG: VWA domain-containing protein [Candidatus Saccharibacteria bacterium]|nr:VWA domain-containing protein [Pseudorhodobacter sp.]
MGSRTRLTRFGRDESGTLVIFALMLTVLMMMMGGIAVDLMRYESRRTSLQNTLDRSTLAAAALTQNLVPRAVVDDYFLKAGLMDYLTSVTVTQGLNFRSVTATAAADTNPLFLSMMGIKEFDAPGISSAEQRVNNVEIVLVLDISGSMGGAKITNLRSAASSFVDTVLLNDPEKKIAISVVPYNAQVNLTPDLLAEFNVTTPNSVVNASCLELPASTFTTPGLSTLTPLPMIAYADTASTTSKVDGFATVASSGAMVASGAACQKGTMNQVFLPNQTPTALKAKINALQAGGNTSIMYGMRWATTLLDPAARQVYTNLINKGLMPANLAGRPVDYSDKETLKVIVVMTDGEHVSHEVITPTYKTDWSPIYKSIGDGNYSIRHTTGRPAIAGTNEYWVPHLATGTDATPGWKATPWNSGAGVSQMDWKTVWPELRTSWVEWQLYARALGTTSTTRNTIFNNMVTAIEGVNASATTMDSQLQQLCTLAKTNGVVVYGIAFEAPAIGQTQIRNCSTDGENGSHYFDAQGLEIATAFNAIANNISQLRLTQ